MIIDEYNNCFAKDTDSVDAINEKFYGRFQFPQAPASFYASADPYFETIMLNQSVGSWNHSALPRKPKIWVAGCGTNQGIFTALRFPDATIVASDLSEPSLAKSAKIAQQLKVAHIEFRHESINNVPYRDEFDYVICTGVIHHNADPQVPLSKLAMALKPTGILELMVYNRYQRILTTAFQKAIRTLLTGADFDQELQMARKVIGAIKVDSTMVRGLKLRLKDRSEVEFADSFLQPVEYSFTVESLESLCASCGLELIAPCINQFDSANGTFSWNLEFDDPEVSALYDSLSDANRWKISNHLMMEKSPMLWFYLQRSDSERPKKSEKEICQEFLEHSFVRSYTEQKHYFRTSEGCYVPSSRRRDYPGSHPDTLCNKILTEIASHPNLTIRNIFERKGIKCSFSTVNSLRLCLTTNEFPYLICTSA
jgi:2-polyprenyl-3-methyl-5-hydroxy-6-metoxy-1,4-benzoquinol methylase